ncbi:hypothetical protein ACHEXK_05135 [Limnohabitans sp. DCL3]|uniref:hypothetical protein n=1 Tax=Limnohabitans sp. DCL3 TaxID=3374103 RepID=UPI003A89775E
MGTVTNPRTILSTAWAGMLVVLLAMLLMDPLQHAMAGQYEALTLTLQHDPGTLGLRVLIGMLCANTLMQVGIQMFGGHAWRKHRLDPGISLLLGRRGQQVAGHSAFANHGHG